MSRNKSALLPIAFVFAMCIEIAAPISWLPIAASAYAESSYETGDGMRRVQMMLKKLKASLASLNDLEELRKAGMPERDVLRMEKAMQKKIEQMINDSVEAIHEI